jgi:hypothetical protein
MVWALFAFFIFVSIAFVVLAILFPEWFGITGKKALEIQKHQQGDNPDKTETNN